jgi:hypothetical protein
MTGGMARGEQRYLPKAVKVGGVMRWQRWRALRWRPHVVRLGATRAVHPRSLRRRFRLAGRPIAPPQESGVEPKHSVEVKVPRRHAPPILTAYRRRGPARTGRGEAA